MEDSSLIARRLAPFSVRICGSPDLITRTGKPKHPQDFQKLPCITDTNSRYRGNWPLAGDDGEAIAVPVSGPIEVNSPMTVRAAAIAGLGFALLPDFIAAPAIESGELLPVLDERILPGAGIYAVYPHRRYLPAKVRALVDFLAQWFRARERQ
jgi:DNA-binding transcriptional LysR family regulator